MCVAYTPNKVAEDEAKDAFYTQLQGVLEAMSPHDIPYHSDMLMPSSQCLCMKATKGSLSQVQCSQIVSTMTMMRDFYFFASRPDKWSRTHTCHVKTSTNGHGTVQMAL